MFVAEVSQKTFVPTALPISGHSPLSSREDEIVPTRG